MNNTKGKYASRKTLTVINLLILLVVMQSPNKVQAFCMKPNPPFKPFSFTTNQQVGLYNQQVVSYNREVEKYGECSERENNSYSDQFSDHNHTLNILGQLLLLFSS